MSTSEPTTTSMAAVSAPPPKVRGPSQRAVGRAAVAPPERSQVKRSGGLAAYLLVMVSLQIFLLVVAVEGVLSHNGGLARAAAGLSVGLWLIVMALRRLMPRE